MKLKRYILGLLQSNGYVIYQQPGGDCYIVDPGARGELFLDFIREQNLVCRGILLTHHHHDHVGAVDKITRALSCPVHIHRLDQDAYRKPSEPLEDGDVLDLEGEAIRVMHTPGHTRGSVCFFSEKSRLAFTGDTIFNVDLGRTDLADGSQAQMERTIRDIIDRWPNDITIHPGHGDPCTMKTVRTINHEFLDILRG
jgi:glyoxylase-like metal-dependent hydrolase (beta-lactamase superfamily II)